MNLFADSLRMVNDEALLDTYELEDVEEIYEILVGLYPDNLQYQEDLISFVYNILDDEDRTILLIEKVMIRIDHKRNYLKNILHEIKSGRGLAG